MPYIELEEKNSFSLYFLENRGGGQTQMQKILQIFLRLP